MSRNKRPNVVIFYTDQQRYDSLGCNGNPHAVTPNLDALAAAGTNFHRYIVAQPVCGPSRCCLMSGRYPSGNGVWQNGVPLPRAEYKISPPNINRQSRKLYGHDVVSHVPTLADAFKQAGYHTRSCEFIAQRTNDDEPFLLFASFPDPHAPITPPAELARQFEQRDTLMPHFDEATLSRKPEVMRDYKDRFNMDAGQWPKALIRLIRQYTDAMVHLIDKHVGRVCESLKNAGLWENTIVVFSSDHGDWYDPKIIVQEHHEKSKTLFNIF